ncbi:HEPN domain-containing protein [Caballeronia sp. SEWSISQ10-4 2]|uniref:HEPN domain-containing protein n=1 Tax=Caballeronia sp. SEWSISQ10-4 2 TaxID=2937438 RepID=UPI002653DD28|nr:HEPN domain-containing protein [Caballeronia sp. SEWSISQ10-4 2]MDN7176983.1 HEPN domain-containing protein [Caballeronia sp. SEWSISQ10-4 2]
MDYRNLDLPPEAGNVELSPFEPNDEWLADAPPELLQAAMLRWFCDRYEDPANQTPWDGEDKDYVYVWGGPYDPNDEIQERFGHIVPYEIMEPVIHGLYRDVGNDWAPIQHEGVDYDGYLSQLVVSSRDDPYRFLVERLDQIDVVLDTVAGNPRAEHIVHQMAHGSMIAALEAYLSDTLKFWLEADEQVLRRFVATNKDFQSQSLTLSEIFVRFDKLKESVKDYLSTFMWHRLDKVKPILKATFQIDLPDISMLMAAVKVRHDIVHRAGRDADGNLVILSKVDVQSLRDECKAFAEAINQSLEGKYPRGTAKPWDDAF